uniref:AAA+ ATPase domain-containing protein n=1 Tax=Fagus sylvatica TaxID=28930 RepID=A0A2N9J428_FAGSY
MELAAAAFDAVLAPICNFLCGCVTSKITTALTLRSNLDAMDKDMKSLLDRRKEVEDEKKEAEKEGNVIRAQVVKWLDDVEKLQHSVEEMVNDKKPSACFLNCRKRYRASKEVEKTLQDIKKLLEDGKFPNGVFDPKMLKKVEHIGGPSVRGQTTASKALAETMGLLNDEVGRIGIWGPGGVGKTTLVINLNNELQKTNSMLVIWVTVSKFDIKNIQTQIARRLHLGEKMGESTKEMAIRLHQRLVNEEKFLLILDDVWDKVDLDTLGVPRPEDHNYISTYGRDVVHLEEIKPFAEDIVKECCGLPLAIIVVGAAMRRKKKVELWEHALNELRRSVPFVEDIEVEVYKPLKWSYDSLQGNNIKSCFLYCSLFPEDYSFNIPELVQCWMGEGLIDEQQDHEHRVNTGIALIEKLKDSCLLESGFFNDVKMHDVVRDVAIWIASSHDDGCKSLVRSGIGLCEISVEEFSNKNSLKRVSFMGNKLKMLPDCVIEQCSEASTLLLQSNEFLEAVPDRFLQGFAALRVLNLRGTNIQSLPRSLLQLRDLGVLNLRFCKNLKGLPSLAGLSKLQILDLSLSSIIELPDGMENLRNLRQLDLSSTYELKDFQVGIISKLPRLEVLDMRHIAYYFEGNGAEEETQTTFEELRQLHRLLFLCISFNRIPHLKFEDLSWIKKLRGFQILIMPQEHMNWKQSTTKVKEVTIRQVDIAQESVRQLCTIAESLIFFRCQGLHEKVIDLDINSICHGLKSLEFYSMKFNRSLEPNGEMASDCDLLPNLEKLKVDGLEGPESISELLGYLGLSGLRFLSLKSINVCACYNMKYLLSCGDFIQTLPNLKVMEVSECPELFELFNYDSRQNMALDPIVPKLQTLELFSLPKLRTLCRHKETWPCLEQVKVSECENLRRLPLSNQNAGTIKEIEGESKEWWNALEWDDDETKSSLLPYFYPASP